MQAVWSRTLLADPHPPLPPQFRFKAKFAKLEEKAKAEAEARGAAGDGGADPEQLAARDKEIESLQSDLAAAKENCEAMNGYLVAAREALAAATAGGQPRDAAGEEEAGGQLAELRGENEELHEALSERDGIIAMAKVNPQPPQTLNPQP